MRAIAACIVGGCALPAALKADWTVLNLTPPGAWDAAVFAVTPTSQYGSARLGVVPDTPQALAWHGSPSSWTNLGGGPGTGSHVYAVSGHAQVGTFNSRATLWQGTPESRVDLHPAGAAFSEARVVSEAGQFGYTRATITSSVSAARWSGSAASYASMNPPGATASSINGAWGTLQGGAATFNSRAQAGLWSGSAASFVSLHPPSQWQSAIAGMWADEQVGQAMATQGGSNHAALWRGSAATFVDLDPGWGFSVALATCGRAQAGYALLDSSLNTRAVVWFGTAASVHDLTQYLPPVFQLAGDVDRDGWELLLRGGLRGEPRPGAGGVPVGRPRAGAGGGGAAHGGWGGGGAAEARGRARVSGAPARVIGAS